MNLTEYIGKHVCYGNENGGFCWGKIKSVVRVNTPQGEADVFVLTDRIVCSGKPYKGNIRHIDKETTLRLDKIDLKRDIVVKDEVFKDLTDDELFLLMMDGEVNTAGNYGRGVQALIESAVWDSSIVKQALENRLAK